LYAETVQESGAKFFARDGEVRRCACELHAEEVVWETEVADLVLLLDVVQGRGNQIWVAHKAAVIDVCAKEHLL
jgi:uncharacterized protein (DUF1330 family)